MSQTPVTSIIHRAAKGEPKAADELLLLVYDELRRLAAARIAREAPGQTLQATALVHEAWIRLSRSHRQQWQGRSHFFGAAAEAMRRILIDHARSKAARKRCGEQVEFHESAFELTAPTEEMVAVHEALDALAVVDKTTAEVVKLRYFVGLTVPEIADALDLAPRTVDRHWAFARAWLKRAIRGEPCAG
jgi:RNA polymerase sigma factor (TIGR02999 family)